MNQGLGKLVTLAILLFAGVEGYKFIGDHWPAPAAARAALTLPDGSPLPDVVPAGSVLAVSTGKSHLFGGQSSRLEIQPEAVGAGALRLEGYTIIPVGQAPQAITLRLYVARGGTLDAASKTIRVGDAPPPKPGPGPKPDEPQPPPVDAAADAAVRRAAAAYFGAYAGRYRADAARIAATGIGYNDLMTAQLKDRDALGTALGQAIDALVRPTVADGGNFKDRPAGVAAFTKVAASLAAGIGDAASQK
jgi:hypothetical protein